MKGYYRLAKAQSEQNEFDAALATINKGLNVGAGNDKVQKKMMRKLKAEVKEAKTEEYRQTVARQFQGAFDPTLQLMNSLGMMNRERDLEKERKFIEKMMKEDKICMHGINPMHFVMAEGRFYLEFRGTFLKGLNNVSYQTTKYRLGEQLSSAFDATIAKFPQEWKDASKIGMVRTQWVAEGTTCLLGGDIEKARTYACFSFFLQEIFSVLNGTKAVPNCARVQVLLDADEHTLVKFLKHHIPCCCLDEKYKEVKSTAKMSFCYNEHCSLPDRRVERSKASTCSGCRQAFYCSRECQVADWKRHKIICGVNVATMKKAQKTAFIEAGMVYVLPTASQSAEEPNRRDFAERYSQRRVTDEHVTTPIDGSPETSAPDDVAD
ncbi:hypothetical protein ACHAXM_002809 [Skeletonema potamos]|jgi:hypothetical protein